VLTAGSSSQAGGGRRGPPAGKGGSAGPGQIAARATGQTSRAGVEAETDPVEQHLHVANVCGGDQAGCEVHACRGAHAGRARQAQLAQSA
jgi:hypothetical protein